MFDYVHNYFLTEKKHDKYTCYFFNKLMQQEQKAMRIDFETD